MTRLNEYQIRELRDILERMYDNAWQCGNEHLTDTKVGDTNYCIRDVIVSATIEEIMIVNEK